MTYIYSHCVLGFMTIYGPLKIDINHMSIGHDSILKVKKCKSLMLIFNEQAWNITMYSGLNKPGEVGKILALYQLKSHSFDSEVKLKSTCFFLLLFFNFFLTNLSFSFYCDEFITKFKTININGLFFFQKFNLGLLV